MTKFHAIMPVLKVVDLQRSIDWYANVLGFDADGPFAGDGAHCFVRSGDAEVLLSTGSHFGGKPSFTGTLYFRVTGVDALFGRISGRAEVVWPLEAQEYGTREFGIRDPDGYILAFAEPNSADSGVAPDAARV